MHNTDDKIQRVFRFIRPITFCRYGCECCDSDFSLHFVLPLFEIHRNKLAHLDYMITIGYFEFRKYTF